MRSPPISSKCTSRSPHADAGVFYRYAIARLGPRRETLFVLSDDPAVLCANKLRLKFHVPLQRLRVARSTLIARTLLEFIEGQQMVSGGDVNDTSIAEKGE